MAPLPLFKPGPSPAGQTTIFATINGALGVAQPTPLLDLAPNLKKLGVAK
jgi:hypothetical protein